MSDAVQSGYFIEKAYDIHDLMDPPCVNMNHPVPVASVKVYVCVDKVQL